MRLAVISDIHGNLLALEAVIADIGARGVDATVNLGDNVAGPLWPRETAERLATLALPTVRGNHDRWMLDREDDSVPETDRSPLSSATRCTLCRQLSTLVRISSQYMARPPTIVRFSPRSCTSVE